MNWEILENQLVITLRSTFCFNISLCWVFVIAPILSTVLKGLKSKVGIGTWKRIFCISINQSRICEVFGNNRFCLFRLNLDNGREGTECRFRIEELIYWLRRGVIIVNDCG